MKKREEIGEEEKHKKSNLQLLTILKASLIAEKHEFSESACIFIFDTHIWIIQIILGD